MKDRNKYEHFLMNEMTDYLNQFHLPALKAYTGMCAIAAGGRVVGEVPLQLYLAGMEVSIDKETLMDTLCKFVAWGHIEIDCDCGDGLVAYCLKHNVIKHEAYDFTIKYDEMGGIMAANRIKQFQDDWENDKITNGVH